MTTNDVAIVRQPALPGLAPDVEAATIAAAYHARIDDYGQGVLGLPTLPSAQERAILEQRLAELKRALEPVSYAVADRDRAMKAFGRLFLGYPTLENVNKAEKAATYMIDLGDLPAFAIEAAVDDVKKGRIKDLDPDYPPSSPRMYKIAEAHRDTVAAKERRPIERVLSVKMLSKPLQTPKEAAKVGELMRGLADGMKADFTDRELQERRALLDRQVAGDERMKHREWAALGLEPITYRMGGRDVVMTVALARSRKLIPENIPAHPNAPGRR